MCKKRVNIIAKYISVCGFICKCISAICAIFVLTGSITMIVLSFMSGRRWLEVVCGFLPQKTTTSLLAISDIGIFLFEPRPSIMPASPAPSQRVPLVRVAPTDAKK